MRLCSLAILLLVAPAARADWGLDTSGTVRTFGLLVRQDHPLLGRSDQLVSASRARLGASLLAGDRLEAVVAGDAWLVEQAEGIAGLVESGGANQRVTPLEVRHGGDGYDATAVLDRAQIGWLGPRLEIRVGRLAIGHGSAKVFPTSDIFAPFSGVAFDTEYKPGLDGARLTAPLGERAEVEIYVLPGEAPRDGIYLGRVRYDFDAAGASIYGGTSWGQATAAIDLQGVLGDSGWTAEAFSRPARGLDATRITLGLNHRLAIGLTLFAEGHFDGGGDGDGSGDYSEAAGRDELTRGETFTLGRYQAALGLDYEWTPLLRPSLIVMQSLVDGSTLFAPGLRWDAGQETSVNAGAILSRGAADSEYRLYPDIWHFDVRIYF